MFRDNESGYRKTVLDNGVRIVTESIPQVRSVALGLWYNVGSRDETDEVAGISHFIEHMNFKGTPTRSAAALVRQVEGRGGHLNAFTSKEVTCFHARLVDTQLNKVIDVLTDMVQNSIYTPEDIGKERAVILEELKNIEDTPDELVFDHFIEQVFNGHALGRPIIGRRESLAEINRDGLRTFSESHFRGSQTIVAAAGNLSHDKFVKLVERRLNGVAPDIDDRAAPSASNGVARRQDLHTTTQQAHICWGFRSIPYNHPRKYSLLLLNTILGGGMSSRLFQQIRERHGLAYSVFSFLEAYTDSGIFGVYAGTEPAQAEKTLKMISRVVLDLAKRPVSASQLKRTKDQLKGSLLLSLESPNSRMNRLARSEIHMGEWRSLDDIVASIDAVTSDDIMAISRELFLDQESFTTILWPK